MRDHPEIGFHGGCGGRIRIKDWRIAATGEFRYVAWCERCGQGDPLGYSSVKQTVDGATKYFNVTEPASDGGGQQQAREGRKE